MKLDGNSDNTFNTMLYHDNHALSSVKYNPNNKEKLDVAAGQFEAMFLQMVLRQMRTASDALADEDSPFSSKEQGVYRDIYDGQLAIELAKKQHGGIADMLVKQLSPHRVEPFGHGMPPASNDNQIEQDKVDRVLKGKFNIQSDSVAFESERQIDEPQAAITSMAFQQPLIKKMESGSS